MKSNVILEILKKFKEYDDYINESTATGGAGSYRVPLRPGLRLWDKEALDPYIIPLSKFDNAQIYVDSLDGNIETKGVKRKEEMAVDISKNDERHPVLNDDDGSDLNENPVNSKLLKKVFGKNKIKEATDTTLSTGDWNGPAEFKKQTWDKHVLSPFLIDSEHYHNEIVKNKNVDGKISFKHGYLEKDHPDKGKSKHIITPTEYKDVVNEDLGVWFGTKKKPKGSKQPKGPWVNICKKVDGKHPPCGRPDASSKAYPKCRAAGVAGKMSDSQKKAACQQKRNAEKKDTQTGKGQKPVMTSYKPKKKKTNESVLISLIRKALD
jgi:hypothetical protein